MKEVILLGFLGGLNETILTRIKVLPMILPGILIAITLHELAHGFTAYVLGDPTAKERGRLSINPLVHIDITGFLFLIVAGFGWAKPVPINPMYFKNRKIGTILVSIAGPVTNFLIALIAIFTLAIAPIKNSSVLTIVYSIALYNVVLGFFNLLPFPPLDGSKVIASILPKRLEFYFYKYERYLYFVLLALILIGVTGSILDTVMIIQMI